MEPQYAGDLFGIRATLQQVLWLVFFAGAFVGGIATLFVVMLLTWLRNLFARRSQ